MRHKTYPRLRKPPPEPRYSKFQVAMLYFPDDRYDTASRKLRRWIGGDLPLQEALRRTGYRTSQRHFTETHLNLLKEYFGEPL